ncbi:uncharacterized protein LOC109104465 isoform X5 [Cyprinus carpio]|uniref:Uncharacterized protein LOC109104465 isoform X5 n=1 Tax=Cyprinus carpio TaxID=7962 RepID=A0A9Q9YW87_CYPCA|nr:uncharacterized protein LOC109104465 isoform X5 [Cyprinus carpio]
MAQETTGHFEAEQSHNAVLLRVDEMERVVERERRQGGSEGRSWQTAAEFHRFPGDGCQSSADAGTQHPEASGGAQLCRERWRDPERRERSDKEEDELCSHFAENTAVRDQGGVVHGELSTAETEGGQQGADGEPCSLGASAGNSSSD